MCKPDKTFHVLRSWTTVSCLLAFALVACSPDEAGQTPVADDTNSIDGEAEAGTQPTPEEVPPMSEFLAGSLHSMEPAAPGTFRLEVAGEVHEGQVDGCGWSMRTEEGDNQDRFTATANWRTGDGRNMQLEMWRFVMHDDFFWNDTNEITNQQTFSLPLSVRGKASARQV